MRGVWFQRLFGQAESKYYREIQQKFTLSHQDRVLTSNYNGKEFNVGVFTTPTLRTLRDEGMTILRERMTTMDRRKRYVHLPIQDAFALHYENPNAVFQAASQFNCLEFTSHQTNPEHGISIYEYDHTQGPACALACAAGTLYRNYFAVVDPQHPEIRGQSRDSQINNLDELEQYLRNDEHQYWYVHNGYTFSRDFRHLDRFNQRIEREFNEPSERDILRSLVKIGLHQDVGVTFHRRYEPLEASAAPVSVTQVYASALSCAYSGIDNTHWKELACIVLDAAYEATLWAAVLQAAAHNGTASDDPTSKHKEVFLTFLGGGVFGNEPAWIASAIGRAIAILTYKQADIRVNVCHYRQVHDDVAAMIDEVHDTYLQGLIDGSISIDY